MNAPGKPMTEISLAEVMARRARLVGNLDALSVRLQPANLLHDGMEAARSAARTEVSRVKGELKDLGADMLEDGLGWVSRHRGLLVGGAIATLILAAGARYATRRRTVPLYAAYDMEDPFMNDDRIEDGITEAGAAAARTWDKVREGAEELGSKAGQAYYAARSRAHELTDTAMDRASELAGTARERAAHAADLARERAAHAADIAREKAHEAAEAAREAAEKAREAAGEAREWAKKQPQENPMTVVIVALALGAIAGALLPRGGRDA